jgi:hypothetical protein
MPNQGNRHLPEFLSTIAVAASVSLGIGSATVSISDARTQDGLETGVELFSSCERFQHDGATANMSGVICLRYLAGVWQGIVAISELYKIDLVCPGDAALAAGQIELIFMEWARRNPQRLNQRASDGIVAALVETFPCQAHGNSAR